MMLYLNLWALVLVSVFTIFTGRYCAMLISDDAAPTSSFRSASIGVQFCSANPQVLGYILFFSFASAAGLWTPYHVHVMR
jgi:hypothetical protein